MSKDFEKEYIELAKSEIPDLWSRIEAGLTEKSTPVENTNTAPGNQLTCEGNVAYDAESELEQTDNDAVEKKNKITNVIKWTKKYAGLAAAVLCIALIIPALRFLRPAQSKSSSADASAPEAAAEEITDAEAYEGMALEEAAEESAAGAESYDEAVLGAVPEVLEEMNEAESQENADRAASFGSSADTAKEGAYEEAMSEAMPETASGYNAGSSGTADKKQELSAEEDILRNVIVRVESVQNDVYREDGSTLDGTVYTVIVCEELSGIFEKDEKIKIYQPPEVPEAMKAGQEYEIDIVYGGEEEYRYIVDRIHLF